MNTCKNIFTVDLEEWFVVEVLSRRFSGTDWEELPRTVERNTHKLLDLLERHNVKATWFVLGWVADKYPRLIGEVFEAGHEIGCHSYSHRKVDSLSPDEFRKDTQRAIDAIVKATGNMPFGYRSPSWSINPKSAWAFDILAELGFSYDSSVFPIKHDLYGWAEGPTVKTTLQCSNGKTLIEIPASTYRLMGKNIPIGGGGYFRHSPYWYSKGIIRNFNRQNRAVMFYIHPWEVDDDLPQIEGLSAMQRFRTYSSTSILLYKIQKLLTDFSFTTIADHLGLFKKNRIGF